MHIKTGTKRPKNTYIFSERDLPGYKRRKQNIPDDDADELGPTRSNLYTNNLRDARRKENKGRFVPSYRKAIPSTHPYHFHQSFLSANLIHVASLQRKPPSSAQ